MPAFLHSGIQKPNTFMLWPPSPITVTVCPLKLGRLLGTGIDLRAAIIALSDMSPNPGVPDAFVAVAGPAVPLPAAVSALTARARTASAARRCLRFRVRL